MRVPSCVASAAVSAKYVAFAKSRRNWNSARLRNLALLAGLCLGAVASGAQTAHFSYSYSIQVLGGGFNQPGGVAVDASGNVYVGDSFHGAVDEIPAGCNSSSCVIALGGGFVGPTGVAVDSSGNVYVADENNSAVKEIPAGCTATDYGNNSCTVTTLGGGFAKPFGVAVDSSGNVYVADSYHNQIKELPAGCTATNYGNNLCSSTVLGSGFNLPVGVAIDNAGNVYVADQGDSAIYEMSGCPSSCAVTQLGGPFSNVTGVAVDSSGYVYVADPGHSAIQKIAPGCTHAIYYGPPYTSGGGCPITKLGGDWPDPGGIALDSAGNIYATDDYHNEVKKLTLSNPAFPSTAVGSASSFDMSYLFTFDSGGTIGAPVVLTQGAANLDFTDAGSGTCTSQGTSHNYLAGDTCWVDVEFNPKYAGTRYGAVVLENASGAPIASALSSGTGLAPQVVFSPSTTITLGGGFNQLDQVAVDASGNVYVADFSNSAVEEVPSGCTTSSCVVTLGGGFNYPEGVALDGAGNVYVADEGHNAIKEMPAGCTAAAYSASQCTTTILGGGFSYPGAVAVDAGGNVYVADANNNAVKEIPPGCSTASCVITLGGGFYYPSGVAVDLSGKVYVSDSLHGAVKLVPAGCTAAAYSGSTCTISTVGGGFMDPGGIALDGSGNIYVADFQNKAVTVMPATCASSSCVTAVASSFSGPEGVAIDGSGNVYVGDEGASLLDEIQRTNASSLNFQPAAPGTQSSDSPKSVTVQNIGNSTLSLPITGTGCTPGFNTGVNFKTDTSATCPSLSSATPGTLPAGASCTLAIDFIPQSSGALGDTLTLTDNSLNAATCATQYINMNGTGLHATTTAVASSQNPSAYAQSVTFTATVTGTIGTAPTGTVTFAIDGVTSNAMALSAIDSNDSKATVTTAALGSGAHTVQATYHGDSNFISSTETLPGGQNVGPEVTVWPAGSTIAYGQSLSSSTLSGGTAAVAGAFSWQNPSLAPQAGADSEQVTFTPSDTTDYATVQGTATLTVNQAVPQVSQWPTASAITYGQTLSSSTLTGGTGSVPGGFAWTTPSTVPLVGTQLEQVTFTPTDAVDYATVTNSIPVTVNAANYVVNANDDNNTSTCSPLSSTTSNTTDSDCSLRDALAASASAGGGNIYFDGTVFGSMMTIGESNGTMAVPANTTITGPAAGVTVSGNGTAPVFSVASGVTASITGLTISGGGGSTGGGIEDNGGALTLTNSTVSGNTATDGGGIFTSGGTLTVNNGTFTGNSATDSSGGGGGIFVSGGTANITNSTFTNNTATPSSLNGLGGGIYVAGGGITISLTQFTSNAASNGGAVVLALSTTATISNSTFLSNSAQSGIGGAIASDGALTVNDCTFSANQANLDGGGILVESDTATITYSTFNDNEAVGGAGGAVSSAGTTVIYNSTVSGNSAPNNVGGGIHNDASGTLTLFNAIVAGNTAGASPDIDGTLTGSSYNLIGDGTGMSGTSNGSNNNQVGTSSSPISAGLGTFGSNGGSTQTMIPQPGSAAICAGSASALPAGVTTDQRGNANTNATYLSSVCVDEGSIQTNYAIAFSTGPPASIYLGVPMSPAPAVTLTESGGTASNASGNVAVTDASSEIGGTLSEGLSGGTATFSNLTDNSAVSDDTLTASFPLTSNITLNATSGSFSTAYYTLAVTGGSSQSSPVTQAYATPLQVKLTDAGGNPVVGASVRFAAPPTGASASFSNSSNIIIASTDSNGYATVAAPTANGIAGNFNVTASNAAAASPASLSLTNTAGSFTQIAVAAPATATAGTPFSFTVTAEDSHGNTVTSFADTIAFTSSDGAAALPGNSPLTNGTGTFTATLNTRGTQSITATDTSDSISGTATIIAPTWLVVNITGDDNPASGSNCTGQSGPNSNSTDTSPGCSLRDALLNAAGQAATNISFDSVVFGSAQTIKLTNGTLSIPTNTTISGPGASLVTVSGNSATQVFNIASGATASIAGLTVSQGDDSAGNGGGGIYNAGTLRLSLCVVDSNQEQLNNGGGIFNDASGALIIDRCTISNNSAVGTTAGGNGGGVFNTGTATITNSTFTTNSSLGSVQGGQGGAIFTSSNLTLIESTLIGNEVLDSNSVGSGGGGAIYGSGTLVVEDSTIYGNDQSGTASGDRGGGIYCASGSCTLSNTILAANNDAASSPNPDGTGTFSGASAYNLIGDGTGTAGISNGSSGNQVGTASAQINPNLALASNYGGPTQTMVPLPYSSAICAGSAALIPSNVSKDQRGFSDVTTTYIPDTVCVDVGAVQSDYAIAFTTNPAAMIYIDVPISPAPAVTLSENGNVATFASGTISAADADSRVGGTIFEATSGGVATFPNLINSSAVTDDTFTASLALTNTISLTALSSQFSTAYYTLTVTQGDTQSATVAQAYATQLQVNVTDASGNPVSGTPVTFTSPGTGASVAFSNSTDTITVITDASGNATVAAPTANTVAGIVSVTVTSPSAAAPARMKLTNVAGAFTQIVVAAPSTAAAGFSFPTAVTAEDQYGNQVTTFADNVHVTSSDALASLPPDEVLSGGYAEFTATLNTAGPQTFTVTDTVDSIFGVSNTITVSTPSYLVVNTTNDDAGNASNCTAQAAQGTNATDSSCSLRDALLAAATQNASDITFDSTAFATPETITLSNDSLTLPAYTSVAGPTAALTINGNNLTTPFLNNGVAATYLSNMTITGGNALSYQIGGGIYNDGEMTLTNVKVTGNTANAGAGVFNDVGALLTVSNSVFSSNNATGATRAQGGAIYVESGGEAFVDHSTFSNNDASGGTAAQGGAIFNDGALELDYSTLNGNYASGTSGNAGGGALCNCGGLADIFLSTIAGNYATGSTHSRGGGIVNHADGYLYLSSSTVTGNAASQYGGGIYFENGEMELYNSLVDGNWLGTQSSVAAYDDVDDTTGGTAFTGSAEDQGGNVVGPYNNPAASNTSISLSPLGNYGGATQTVVPLPGGPAICAGLVANLLESTDQRGFPATNSSYPTYSSTPCVDSGAVQTAYAISFTAQPPAAATTSVAISPPPVVGLTESGQTETAATSRITMSDADSALSAGGTNFTSLSAGSATFGNLVLSSNVNNDTLTATMALTSTVNLTATSSGITSSGTPILTWTTPFPISAGTPLGANQLDAVANVPGTFVYTPAAGTVLSTGANQTLSVTFTPTDTTDFTSATDSVEITVNNLTDPTFTWSPLPTIIHGDSGASILNAAVNCTSCGSIGYTATPSGGSIATSITTTSSLAPGDYTITAIFTSTSGSYNSAITTAPLTVSGQSVWVLNGGGGAAELAGNGYAITSSADGGLSKGVAIDGSGNVWTIGTGSTLLEDMGQTGISQHAVSSGGGLDAPSALAVDGNSDVWVANSGNNSVSLYSSAGAALSPSTGYTDSSLASPSGVAVDVSGSVWIANRGNNSVTRILGAAAPVAPLSTAAKNNTTGAKP